MTKQAEFLRQELRRQCDRFRKATDVLAASHRKCSGIGIKASYSVDELEAFDALTARFSRASDLLMQRIFRLLDAQELEEPGTIIDRINRAERRGVIESARSLRDAREPRNQISHEYTDEDLYKLFAKVFELTPVLLQTVAPPRSVRT